MSDIKTSRGQETKTSRSQDFIRLSHKGCQATKISRFQVATNLGPLPVSLKEGDKDMGPATIALFNIQAKPWVLSFLRGFRIFYKIVV